MNTSDAAYAKVLAAQLESLAMNPRGISSEAHLHEVSQITGSPSDRATKKAIKAGCLEVAWKLVHEARASMSREEFEKMKREALGKKA